MKTKTTNKSKTTFKKILALGLLIGLLASIGIGAYLTDSDVKSDVYTVGNVQAEIVSVGDMEVANAGYIIPNTVHQYERAATNTGINDAYVFMSVTIPYEIIGLSDENGTRLPSSRCQMLIPGSADGSYINSEWKLVDVGFIGEHVIAANGQLHGEHDQYSAVIGDTITYVYGYVGDNADGSLKALASGETTSNLIDTMHVANLHSALGSSYLHGEVSTKLYAIQSNHVNGGLTDVNGVWAVVNTAFAAPMNYMIDGYSFNELIPDETTAIEFVAGRAAPADAIDVSEAQDGSVMAWMEGTTFYVSSVNGNKITTSNTFYMFGNKENITSINLENFYTTSIEDATFDCCCELTSCIIPEGVTSIGEGAFAECTSLTSITIPNSVNYIGLQAFSGCSSLKTINFTGTEEQWNTIEFCELWNESVPEDCVINFLGE